MSEFRTISTVHLIEGPALEMLDPPEPIKHKLTIAIPTLDRPEMLQRALDSCLAQTTPVKVLVADQGRTEGTTRVMDRYRDHPDVLHMSTGATSLWANWRKAAEYAQESFGAPYFAWLQDDDILSRIYASRVIKALDHFTDALHWQANCHCSPDGIHALKWGWNGPQIGVRMIDSALEQWPGGFLLASMYVTSWALSPGVAFRCGPQFTAALEGMPSGCDLFSERLILAAMGAQGPWVADPVTAGYWVHHGGNESYKQNASGGLPVQRRIMVEHLDQILDSAGDWREAFLVWLKMRSPVDVLNWLKDFECPESRYVKEIKGIMQDSLHGRVEITQEQPGQNGHATRERVPVDRESVLIFD